MKLLFGMLILLGIFGINLQAQNTGPEYAVWAGGNGSWFGSTSNWICPPPSVSQTCLPPNYSATTPTVGATIGTVMNGIPVSGTVTTDAPFNLSAPLSVGSGAPGTLNITAAGAGSRVSGGFGVSAVIASQGTLNATGGGSLYADALTLNGLVTADGSGSGFAARDLFAGGTVVLQNGGSIGAIFPEIAGNLTVGSGSSISSSHGNFLIDPGANVTLLNGGSLNLPPGAGTLNLSSGATLNFDITAATGNGVVNGPGTLNGTVNVDFLNGFAPTAGETFVLFNLPSFYYVDPTQINFEVSGLAPGFQYQFLDTNNALELEALNNGVSSSAASSAPEPASVFLSLGTLLGLGVLARGRHRPC